MVASIVALQRVSRPKRLTLPARVSKAANWPTSRQGALSTPLCESISTVAKFSVVRSILFLSSRGERSPCPPIQAGDLRLDMRTRNASTPDVLRGTRSPGEGQKDWKEFFTFAALAYSLWPVFKTRLMVLRKGSS